MTIQEKLSKLDSEKLAKAWTNFCKGSDKLENIQLMNSIYNSSHESIKEYLQSFVNQPNLSKLDENKGK